MVNVISNLLQKHGQTWAVHLWLFCEMYKHIDVNISKVIKELNVNKSRLPHFEQLYY